jgi:DNA end-binding protein Ku
VCRETGEEVPLSEIVRGYQYRKGEYVVLDDEDFRRANVHKSQTIEITTFADASEIDQKFLEKPYYMEPVKEAKKAYALLRQALMESGKVGVARYVMRSREHMALIKPQDEVIVLNRMRFADELRPFNQLDLPEKEYPQVSQRELSMAKQLIDQLTEPWDPSKYHDTYFEDLKKIINEKVEGIPPSPVKEEIIPAGVSDLFSRLSESLELARSKHA